MCCQSLNKCREETTILSIKNPTYRLVETQHFGRDIAVSYGVVISRGNIKIIMTSLAVMELNNNNTTTTTNCGDDESRNGECEKYLRELTKTFTGIDKPLKNARKCETLTDLIGELRRTFDSDHVNIEYVNHLMLSYQSNPAEWRKFAKFDRYR
uniref:Cysteine dioxygenase n=1 Tax=Anopheles culicifacies TaxID=139723 RepID=A0A182LTJ9_9DIPT